MKALVLSSGGVDSTTCVGIAVAEYGASNVTTVSIFYGQKHVKELQCANAIAAYYGVEHYALDLSAIFEYGNCPLLQHSTKQIVHKSYAQQIKENGAGKVDTYVPFRNGLFLASVACLAQSIYPDEQVKIFIGAHADDAADEAYADCSLDFVNAMNNAIQIGTYGLCELVAPLVNMNKAQVVAEGLRLKVPYELTWSCYEGGDKPCGKCATCLDRAKAFEVNNIKDPAGDAQ